MSVGHVKIHRQLLHHPFWTRKRRFSRAEAWMDLIFEAAWKPHTIGVGCRKITLNRGEIPHSVRTLSERWGWGLASVNRFLSVCKTDRMVAFRTEQKTRVIILCNYGVYQDKPEEDRNANGNEKRNGSGTAAERTEEGKEKKELSSSISTSLPSPRAMPGTDAVVEEDDRNYFISEIGQDVLAVWFAECEKSGKMAVADKATVDGAAVIAEMIWNKQLSLGDLPGACHGFLASKFSYQTLGVLSKHISQFLPRADKVIPFKPKRLTGPCPHCGLMLTSSLTMSGPSPIRTDNVYCTTCERLVTIEAPRPVYRKAVEA